MEDDRDELGGGYQKQRRANQWMRLAILPLRRPLASAGGTWSVQGVSLSPTGDRSPCPREAARNARPDMLDRLHHLIASMVEALRPTEPPGDIQKHQVGDAEMFHCRYSDT
jgi:hypothetical protein